MNIKKIDKERGKLKRKKIYSIAFFMVVAIIVVSIVVYSLLTSKFQELSHTIKNLSNNDNFPVVSKQHSLMQIESLDNCMVVLSKASVLFYDYKGNLINEYLHGFTNPVIKINGQYVLVYDRGGFNYQLISPFKKHYEQTMPEKIITANVAKNGNVGVAVFDSQFSSLLNVYDSNSKIIFKWFSAAEKVIDIAFNDNSKNISIASCIPSNGVISSVVYGLDINKDDEIFKISLSDATPYSLTYKGDNLCLITDNTVTTINKEGIVKSSYMINADLMNFINKENNTYLTVNSYLSNNHSLVYINKEGVVKSTLDLNNKITCSFYENGIMYYINPESFIKVNTVNQEIKELELDSEYKDFIVFNGKCFLLNNNSINLFENPS